MSAIPRARNHPAPWEAVLFPALAGGMGWGIRGQFGHETGAMIAGVLVGLTLLLSFGRGATIAAGTRAAALAAVALGIGGSMTYGQTIGLTQDRALVGCWPAWWWGMTGLGLKGAIWSGFAGLFLGLGFGSSRLSWRGVLTLLAALWALYLGGVWLLNSPHQPADRQLPLIYFSASWRWFGADAELKPRPEVWGGLLVALLGAWAWIGWWRRDLLVRRLTVWGMVGGLGFPLGQCLQSYHAWNPQAWAASPWAALAPRMNWWNWMETLFGVAIGACLGLGLWRNRDLITLRETENATDRPLLPEAVAWTLLGVHGVMLLLADFSPLRWARAIYDPGLAIAVIPLVAIAGHDRWPRWVLLPVTLLPIAGKMIRHLVYETPAINPVAGWFFYGILPLAVIVLVAARLERRPPADAAAWAQVALPTAAWIYFALNFAFFDFPWPWEPWTVRTPNAVAFAICLAGLTYAAVRTNRVARTGN
ncbi:MAG: hypothetical protein RIR76_896 [Verrucomicrobiota bacterium]|jgi:hypothetical protein|nr:hypothetical protein [Opitutaceae bacterium]